MDRIKGRLRKAGLPKRPNFWAAVSGRKSPFSTAARWGINYPVVHEPVMDILFIYLKKIVDEASGSKPRISCEKVIHNGQINFAILRAFSNFDLNLMG
jgi:hypothetical protein